jgi:hypothetical protein
MEDKEMFLGFLLKLCATMYNADTQNGKYGSR